MRIELWIITLPARIGTSDQPMANAFQQIADATSLLQYLMPMISDPDKGKFISLQVKQRNLSNRHKLLV